MQSADLVRLALPLHGLTDSPFTVLRSLGDTVARVDTPAGPTVLRVCEPGTAEARLAEVSTFQNAAAEAGLTVPHREAARALALPDGTHRWTVRSTWVDGEAPRPVTAELARALGKATAQLHALDFHPPQDWTGPVYGAAWLRGWWEAGAPRHLSADDHERCAPAVAQAAIFMEAHAAEARVIHSDLHFGNVLLAPDGQAAVLDFDGCAVAHPAFDLALTERELLDFPEAGTLTEAYRASYAGQSRQPYPFEAVEQCRAATGTAFLEWVYGSRNPEVRAQKEMWVLPLLDDLALLG
ncbi:phosphotransferase enzyme family protein [Deinococcus budaensis]|uniref:Ser/Thr protein kinase RdoA (MazF antagonist) n=1 Tax=Deinococcus budaensis TaxID=1665626 RepID=A0A7W8GFF8_9DEIO|nr:phosphotransferase [Deinococcus budaensis]MBB5234580.1 Ser/Thr protein kinase RdoA (MazF antagonist) [Deinococcus budaensis]